MPASEQSFAPAPRALEEFLSPDWLSAALGVRYPGIRISRVVTGPTVSRISTNVRFHIECEGGLPEGLSADLCGKGYFSDLGWATRKAGVFEVSFYRDLAERSGVRTLRCVYADVDHTTDHGVVITEDVVAQGAEFLDPTSAYTPASAAESLAQLARLHAGSWNNPADAAAAWLAPRFEDYSNVRGVAEIRANFESAIGAGVPEEVRDAERLFRAHRALGAQMRSASPWTVVHGDAHVGNIYLDASGRPAFLDWQLVQRAPWYIDVGYHIASTLDVEDRRTSEQELLRHYLDSLRSAGVESVPAWDEAWLGVRRGIIHGFYLWGITVQVAPAFTSALLHRLGTAAADHKAFDAVS